MLSNSNSKLRSSGEIFEHISLFDEILLFLIFFLKVFLISLEDLTLLFGLTKVLDLIDLLYLEGLLVEIYWILTSSS